MQVTLSARHAVVPESVRRRAETRLERLERFEPRATAADVLFTVDHGVHRVEIRLAGAGHVSVAHGAASGFQPALDQALDRLARQLRRRVEMRHDRKGPRAAELAAANGA